MPMNSMKSDDEAARNLKKSLGEGRYSFRTVELIRAIAFSIANRSHKGSVVGVHHLETVVAAITHDHMTIREGRYSSRSVELIRPTARSMANRSYECPVDRVHDSKAIVAPIRHDNMAIG